MVSNWFPIYHIIIVAIIGTVHVLYSIVLTEYIPHDCMHWIIIFFIRAYIVHFILKFLLTFSAIFKSALASSNALTTSTFPFSDAITKAVMPF